MKASEIMSHLKAQITETGDVPVAVRIISGPDAGAAKEVLEFHFDEDNDRIIMVVH